MWSQTQPQRLAKAVLLRLVLRTQPRSGTILCDSASLRFISVNKNAPDGECEALCVHGLFVNATS